MTDISKVSAADIAKVKQNSGSAAAASTVSDTAVQLQQPAKPSLKKEMVIGLIVLLVAIIVLIYASKKEK